MGGHPSTGLGLNIKSSYTSPRMVTRVHTVTAGKPAALYTVVDRWDEHRARKGLHCPE